MSLATDGNTKGHTSGQGAESKSFGALSPKQHSLCQTPSFQVSGIYMEEEAKKKTHLEEPEVVNDSIHGDIPDTTGLTHI